MFQQRGMSVACAVLMVLAFPGLSRVRAASPQQINDAVARGVKFLYSIEKDGNWEEGPRDPAGLDPNGGYSTASRYGGFTAIATYALLAAGEKNKDNPSLQSAVKWLAKTDLRGTYAVALREQVWLLSEPSAARDAARDADARFLLNSVIQKGANAGFYGYNFGALGQKPPPVAFGEGGPVSGSGYDRSNSQYGVLGAWAAEHAGAEIPREYWELVDKGWRHAQQNDGGWNYRMDDGDPGKVTPTMTCAGVASLFITQDYLLRLKKWDACAGGTPDINIENGLAYVEKHIQELIGVGDYYGMYGVERIATASGRRYFGSVDWFRLGADYAVQQQQPSGAWVGRYGPVADTALAILFLSRGRAPVMINKLQYAITPKKETGNREKAEQVDPWNERPRDVANLVHWVGPRIETNLNWQIVNLNVSPEQLHDAPILYISGNQALAFTDEEINKLRVFVQQGGMILGAADCGSAVFSTSFKKLGSAMFKYEFRMLPAGHVILNGEQYRAQKWRLHPHITAMSNGVRELMILLPDGDPGRAWQSEGSKIHPELFELGADIFLYASDRQNLFFQADPYVVVPTAAPVSKHLKIARIETDGNWDPEPGGWARLAAIFHNTRNTQLDVEPVKLGSGKLAGYPIAHLTGTSRISFSNAQRQELQAFVAKHGTLIVDAAGGDAEFANSIEAELKTIFGQDADDGLAKPLAMDAPVFSAGEKTAAIGYRVYASRATGSLKAARLCGVSVGGRIGVFYSREDISAGLVGEPVDGIVGYNPASATQLMSNMITFAQPEQAPANATPGGGAFGAP